MARVTLRAPEPDYRGAIRPVRVGSSVPIPPHRPPPGKFRGTLPPVRVRGQREPRKVGSSTFRNRRRAGHALTIDHSEQEVNRTKVPLTKVLSLS